MARLSPQARDLARARALKLLRLSIRPGLWRTAAAGVVPSLDHQDVPFRDQYGTVLDVGAHSGQFASFAHWRWPQADLHAFEPLPEPRAKLRALLGDQDGVTIHPVALGDHRHQAQLHIAADSDSSSLLPIGSRLVELVPTTREVGTVEVKVETLDQLLSGAGLPGPILLKIDVQGTEAAVLAGAKDLLESVEDVLVECSFQELYAGQPPASETFNQLQGAGFELAAWGRSMRDDDGRPVQGDFFFSRGRGTDGG